MGSSHLSWPAGGTFVSSPRPCQFKHWGSLRSFPTYLLPPFWRGTPVPSSYIVCPRWHSLPERYFFHSHFPIALTTMTTWQLDHKSFVSPTSTLLQDDLLLMSSPTSPPISSTSSCCEPNMAIVQLMTTLTISDYSRFYDGPIGEFLPTYSQLADGSLVAPPFLQDLKVAFASLLLMGAYLLLSIRNIIVSFRFIRRMKVKNKDLFYMLFASQVLSLVIWIPLVVAMFDTALDCTTILRVTRLFSSVSTDIMVSLMHDTSDLLPDLLLQITGIFGVKAYRCLGNARFVPVLMALLQIANSTLTVNDLVQLHGIRGLSGLCSCLHPSDMLPVVVILIFVESFFICCCCKWPFSFLRPWQ
ncbi:hypothetical protein HETIRDRAFT_166842 [Heterobasidion irregulare TC 32-1]|uniref:Uncharacterized protein n=1 Tax=Heterobasidion irregulare (strain TC 32-1) TaxID=747525 RepID=W4KPK8_HETIT|nr:uncharacterized protein HETIRDRAFT_166842 [Heterobasidion irregulare TC 32-1]ETW87305.1 hypothetical protein HETIRDRAFT_166842 [Heterobasidion irregulare TC 32-1]